RKVDGDGALIAVEAEEVERILPLGALGMAAGIAHAGALDLDDVGAQPGEQLRGRSARLVLREIEDAHLLKRRHAALPFLSPPASTPCRRTVRNRSSPC